MSLTRRQLLVGACASVATSRIRGAEDEGPRFAVRSPLEGKTLRDRVLLAARLGFEGIEIGGAEYFAPPADEILAAFEGTSVKVSAVSALQDHVVADANKRAECIAENKRRLHKARALGATAMVVVPVFGQKSPYPDRTPAEENRLLVEALKALAPTAEETGVKVIMEPLTKKETYFMNYQHHAYDIAKKVGSPAVGVLSDFYHMQMEEKDIPGALEAVIDRMYYVHVADGEARTVPGSLPFDYRPGFAVLKRHKYRGWITIEARPSGDVAKSLASGLAYLKQQWADA